MSKLIDALKKKYRTPEAALQALGLDVSLLRGAVTGDSAPTRISRKPRLARDAAPTEQFRREQLAGSGEDDDFPHSAAHPELAALLREMGLDDEQIERACTAAVDDRDMSCDANDPEARLGRLRDYLKPHLSDAEIDEACEIARKDMGMGEDLPPPFPGRPTPGGAPLKDEQPSPRSARARPEHFSRTSQEPHGTATDSRNAAMDAACRIQIDNSIGVQSFGSPTPQSKQARRQLATDAARSTSSRATDSFFARFPDTAKIGQA
jgi:hypothetical protein